MKKLIRSSGWGLLDSLWLIMLALFIFAGRDKVPFHGDEATLISMSRDYFYLFREGDLDRVLYDPTPENEADQELRMINGTLPKWAMGLAEDIDEKTLDDLPQSWDWGWTLDQNRALGHYPNWWVLRAARTSSALLTAISVAGVFFITRMASRRPAAYAASLIYVTTPAVLLNGRRAMMEGAHLCFVVLAVWAVLWVVREQARQPVRRRVLIAQTALFAVLSGAALASKHTAFIAVGAGFLALMTEPLIRALPEGAMRNKINRRRVLRWIGAVVLMLFTFVLLNPTWWSDPLGMPLRVIKLRNGTLSGQVRVYGGYDNVIQRFTELAEQSFSARPQYAEARDFTPFIAAEIQQYEDSGLMGRGGGPIWMILLAALLAAGLFSLRRRWRDSAAWMLLLWITLTALALLITVPFDWQRYYLPMQPPLAVVMGIGAGMIVERVIRLRRHDKTPKDA
jgi:4-amino-4-deoxy-L-arabinose transferase-like glycosyltransferase